MTSPSNAKKTLELHKKMLEYQKTISPFLPHLKELAEVFGYRGAGAATRNQLLKMVEMGLVITRRRGTYLEYYAIAQEGRL